MFKDINAQEMKKLSQMSTRRNDKRIIYPFIVSIIDFVRNLNWPQVRERIFPVRNAVREISKSGAWFGAGAKNSNSQH